MTKFWVSGIGTVTFTETVEAETLEEAKQKMKNVPLVDLSFDTEEIEITDGAEVKQ